MLEESKALICVRNESRFSVSIVSLHIEVSKRLTLTSQDLTLRRQECSEHLVVILFCDRPAINKGYGVITLNLITVKPVLTATSE